MYYQLIKEFNWTENGNSGTEKNIVGGFKNSNMGKFLMIRWTLEEFEKEFPEEMGNLTVLEEWTERY